MIIIVGVKTLKTVMSLVKMPIYMTLGGHQEGVCQNYVDIKYTAMFPGYSLLLCAGHSNILSTLIEFFYQIFTQRNY